MRLKIKTLINISQNFQYTFHIQSMWNIRCLKTVSRGRSWYLFSAYVLWWRMTFSGSGSCLHTALFIFRPGRTQQEHCNRFNLWRLGFTIAIHPLIWQHFVEIYPCHWSEDTLNRWIGELWMRTVAQNLHFSSSSPPLSFIVALFCAAAIFNRLVLHSHPCRLNTLKGKTKAWKCCLSLELFREVSANKWCVLMIPNTPALKQRGLSRLFLNTRLEIKRDWHYASYQLSKLADAK